RLGAGFDLVPNHYGSRSPLGALSQTLPIVPPPFSAKATQFEVKPRQEIKSSEFIADVQRFEDFGVFQLPSGGVEVGLGHVECIFFADVGKFL
ncbi:MAG: hypothetical protein ACOCWJ_06150, partial [Verrucomicrobiota bacterium]